MANLHITKGTGKMEYIKSINTSTKNNPFCKKMAKVDGCVCQKCYARQFEGYRKSLHDCLVKNTEILLDPDYQPEKLNILRVSAVMRIHSFGEFANMTQFENVMKLAIRNSDIRFVIWTKRKDLVYNYDYPIPSNVRLIYSNPRLNNPMCIIPGLFHAVFNVVTADYAFKNKVKVNCKNKCIECMKCYGDQMHTRIINEVVKRQQNKYNKLMEME